MALAVVLILLVVGSVAFHFLSPWYFTPLASNWGLIDFTVNITFVVTGIVFVAANLFMAYCLIRYRHRKGHCSWCPSSHWSRIPTRAIGPGSPGRPSRPLGGRYSSIWSAWALAQRYRWLPGGSVPNTSRTITRTISSCQTLIPPNPISASYGS